MKKLLIAAGMVLTGMAAVNAATVNVTSDISTSTQWTADNEYILKDVIFVKNGATLWIEPGTVIRGEVTGNDYPTTALWVSRGGKLYARGTKEKPIIFTDMWDDNFPWTDPSTRNDPDNPYSTINPHQYMDKKGEQWGGLVLCGKAYVTIDNTSDNVGPLVETEPQAEGLAGDGAGSTKYGGNDDDDSSGVLSYVSVRYGGYGLKPASEINGISLYGVGRGTQIDHVEVVGNLDDGIEFFGGTVNTKYVAIFNIGDDSFDVDQGYRGRGQFIFLMQGFCDASDSSAAGSGIGNHVFEMDGVEKKDGNMPWALQRYENVTLIGHRYLGVDGNYAAEKENNSQGFQLDDNCRAQFFNVIAMDVDSVLVAIESDNASFDSFEGMSTAATSLPTHNPGAGANTYTPYYYTSQNQNYNQTAFENFVVYNCAPDYYMYKTDSSNGYRAGGEISTAGMNWNTAASMPIRYMERESASDVNRPMPAAGNGLLPNIRLIDPRPVAAWGSSPYTAEVDGFASPVSYYGAFAPTGETWLEGWSALSTAGMLTNTVSATAAVELDQAAFTVGFAGTVGASYTLEESLDSGDTWTPVVGASTVVADKVNMTLSDFGVEGVASKLYRVVTE